MVSTEDLSLFLQIIDLDPRECDAFARGCELVQAAVSDNGALRADANLAETLCDFASTRAQRVGLKAIQVIEDRPFPVVGGIVPALRLLLAWRGHPGSKLIVARVLMWHSTWATDISEAERQRRLIQALGAFSIASGRPALLPTECSLNPVDVVLRHGYALAGQIKGLRDLRPVIDHAVSGDQRDAHIDPAHGLPERLCGMSPLSMYICGAESMALTAGVLARRIAERMPATAVYCARIIDDPMDPEAIKVLVEALEEQSADDAAEEIEALYFLLAQLGDPAGLQRSAVFALRRGYHEADRDYLQYAVGCLALAGGCLPPAADTANMTGTQRSITSAGEWLIRQLQEAAVAGSRIPDVKDENPKTANDSTPATQDVVEDDEIEPTNEELQEIADRANATFGGDMKADDLKPDADMPPSVLKALKAKTQEVVKKMRARNCGSLLERAERIRIIECIGNKDVGSVEARAAARALEPLMVPLPMAPMPADLVAWRSELLAEFPHAEAAINAIHADLESRRLNGRKGFLIRPTLLVGKPGTGKSRLARRIAEVSEMPYRMFPCASVADGHIAGVSRGWSSGHPSLPLDAMRAGRCPNPILVMDEIEKSAESRRNGNVVDAVLSMLEPETARAWVDPFIQGPINLSAINWLMTANSLSGLPAPFLDRVRILHVDEPEVAHVPALAASILADLAAASGHAGWLPPLDGDELATVARGWKRHKSLRHLRRLVEGVLRARDQAALRH